MRNWLVAALLLAVASAILVKPRSSELDTGLSARNTPAASAHFGALSALAFPGPDAERRLTSMSGAWVYRAAAPLTRARGPVYAWNALSFLLVAAAALAAFALFRRVGNADAPALAVAGVYAADAAWSGRTGPAVIAWYGIAALSAWAIVAAFEGRTRARALPAVGAVGLASVVHPALGIASLGFAFLEWWNVQSDPDLAASGDRVAWTLLPAGGLICAACAAAVVWSPGLDEGWGIVPPANPWFIGPAVVGLIGLRRRRRAVAFWLGSGAAFGALWVLSGSAGSPFWSAGAGPFQSLLFGASATLALENAAAGRKGWTASPAARGAAAAAVALGVALAGADTGRIIIAPTWALAVRDADTPGRVVWVPPPDHRSPRLGDGAFAEWADRAAQTATAARGLAADGVFESGRDAHELWEAIAMVNPNAPTPEDVGAARAVAARPSLHDAAYVVIPSDDPNLRPVIRSAFRVFGEPVAEDHRAVVFALHPEAGG